MGYVLNRSADSHPVGLPRLAVQLTRPAVTGCLQVVRLTRQRVTGDSSAGHAIASARRLLPSLVFKGPPTPSSSDTPALPNVKASLHEVGILVVPLTAGTLKLEPSDRRALALVVLVEICLLVLLFPRGHKPTVTEGAPGAEVDTPRQPMTRRT
jgi:hypothetical protein